MVVDRHAEVFRAVYDTLVEPPPITPDWAELEARATEAPSEAAIVHLLPL